MHHTIDFPIIFQFLASLTDVNNFYLLSIFCSLNCDIIDSWLDWSNRFGHKSKPSNPKAQPLV